MLFVFILLVCVQFHMPTLWSWSCWMLNVEKTIEHKNKWNIWRPSGIERRDKWQNTMLSPHTRASHMLLLVVVVVLTNGVVNVQKMFDARIPNGRAHMHSNSTHLHIRAKPNKTKTKKTKLVFEHFCVCVKFLEKHSKHRNKEFALQNFECGERRNILLRSEWQKTHSSCTHTHTHDCKQISSWSSAV